MKLRNLELKDAPLMFEWMKDENICKYFKTDFTKKSLEDAKEFIIKSFTDRSDIHLAIVSDDDEYMGTVSLKEIDRSNNSAELSIVVRSVAMKRGYAWFGIEEILNQAFTKYGIENVYWCVSRDNIRAVRFYDKHNFHEALDISENILERYKKIDNLKWYSFLNGDILDNRNEIVGCKIIHIKTIPTVGAGELSFFESHHDVPFDIKRIYYISKVPEGSRRGYHAHKNLKQLLYCPYGRIQLILENEQGREEIELSDPSIGVVIERTTWREMLWLQKDSVLCVAASEFYDVDDYIRNYDDFRKVVQNKK